MYEEYRCGVYAGFASIFGKLCFSNSIDSLPGMGDLMASCANPPSSSSGAASVLNKCLLMYGFSRLMVGGLMILCSVLQFVNFMKALEKRGSLIVTVIASAVSFIITGVLGALIGESLPLTWFLGVALMGAGMHFVSLSQPQEPQPSVVYQPTGGGKESGPDLHALGEAGSKPRRRADVV